MHILLHLPIVGNIFQGLFVKVWHVGQYLIRHVGRIEGDCAVDRRDFNF